jgi:ATP-dependent RNA helicase DeaD
MDEPEFIEVKAETVEEIKQVVIETTDRRKQATLFHLIEKHRPFLERSEQMKKNKAS